MRRMLQLVLIAVLALAFMGADNGSRFSSLGHKMMCKCGCNQVLLECNHVGCTVSESMRQELLGALQKGDSDDLILQGFVQKYGPTVLAAPTTTGFNRVAWVMPYLALALGLIGASLVARNWKLRPALVTAPPTGLPPQELDALRRRAREETRL